MGIFLCCFRSAFDEKHEEANNNDENQEHNVTTNAVLVQDLANECESLLMNGATDPGDDNVTVQTQVEPDVEPEVVNEIVPVGLSLLVQDLKNKCETVLAKAETEPEDEIDPATQSHVEPEVVNETSRLIAHKSVLSDDYILRDDECPICFEEYTHDHPRIITKCSHHYHLNCLYQWQELSGLCPHCSRVAEFEELE
ncbi:uncharacterized protein [Rutidosis leptorrhynchoides]|uniref:uncharacterized protein n=1 Tax=Rutidosis leptorrhynchoides TaxID=125765 RepID=UPI003A9A5095